MSRYPDFRSAAIPALHAAQRLHGWCSPTAIEQAACVMRLTPGYLTAVATFYDMFETQPKGRVDVYVCTNISCSLRGADRIFEVMQQAAGNDPDFHVKSFECLGACDIAPMASIDGEYVGPLEEEDCRRSSTTSRRAAPCSRPSSSVTGKPQVPDAPAPLRQHRPARAEHAQGLPRRARRLRDADAGARHGAGGRPRRAAGVRHPRPRRRRLRDGHEGVVHPQGRHGQVRRLQRRRVRARDVQGPRADAEEPASADRGHLHRRARDRRQQGVHLHPRRVRPPGRRSSRRRSPRPRRRS